VSRYWSDVVQQLVPYVPGEQPALAHPVKLNTNENPYPPSPRVVAAIARELGDTGDTLRRYPDPLARAARDGRGPSPHQARTGFRRQRLGRSARARVPRAAQARPAAALPDISYSFYPTYARLYGVQTAIVPLADDFSIRVDDYLDDAGGVLFPNPNAPTGRALPLADIERIAAANPSSVVLIDEAYVDFGAQSAITLIDRHPNLLVVHTTSKARSLAGMRVGFAFGHVDLIDALNRGRTARSLRPARRSPRRPHTRTPTISPRPAVA
jgi:histidinol-phosphate aminotransferase